MGDFDAFVGDGFDPSLLVEASLLREMLDGRWATFFVAAEAVVFEAGTGSLDFPFVVVVVVRGVPRAFDGDSGGNGTVVVVSAFLVTRWGDCSNDEPFRIFPSSGVSPSPSFAAFAVPPPSAPALSVLFPWAPIANPSPSLAVLLVGGDEVTLLSNNPLSPLPIEDPVNVLSSGLPASSAETPVLNLPGLSSAPFTFLNPIIGPPCPLRSTATKLARTFERGRPDPECSDPMGERPREGGDVALLLLLFSNLASRPRTPP